MRVGVVAETAEGERRVAAVPETVGRLVKAGWQVAVQRGAGEQAFHPDAAYASAGAEVVDDPVPGADVLLSVQPVPTLDISRLPAGASTISMLAPSSFPGTVRAAQQAGITAFALELVPRITRAQAMDVLSSQALVAGYRVALAAAQRLPAFFPMFMTAAGTVPPARVLVLGAGVAGLQTIATCRRLGAVVSAYDVRPAAGEEVKSLGATFLNLELESQEGAGGYARTQSEEFLRQQRELLTTHITKSDVVITTAAVPGRRAPLLVTAEMLAGMRPGSVVVDLAAETGGNCELTEPGETVWHNGVQIYGPRNIPSELPRHASELFARNVSTLLLLMTSDGAFAPDFNDEIVKGCCVTRGGELVHPVAREALGVEEPGLDERGVEEPGVEEPRVQEPPVGGHKPVAEPGSAAGAVRRQ